MASGQERAPRENPPALENLQPRQPSFYIRAEVNHQTHSYREGDFLSVSVATEEDAYVYVLYQDAENKVDQVYPNSQQPDNFVRARQAVRIPASNDLKSWGIGPPFGHEIVKVIACKERLEHLDDLELRQELFTPVPVKALKGVGFELGAEEPPQWSEDLVRIETYPKDHSPSPAGAKRWGVFFGISNYEFNAETEEAGGRGLNLDTGHRDARKLAELLQEVGQLSGVRIRTNKQATKQEFQTAVTSWLPAVSRPGDTVFIYFSGHGSQVADGPGYRDEEDGQDEYLVPYDYLGVDALTVLIKRAQEGKLQASQAARVQAALNTVRSAATVEQGAAALARSGGITDDEFGHWLQRLAGRQVVVILDACHAGGLIQGEKGKSLSGAASFDFLDGPQGELARLKDIGQNETALLATCRAGESVPVPPSGLLREDLSLMTFFLAESLLKAEASLTVESGYEQCRDGMRAYFEKLNTTGPAPQWFNHCTRPPLLKP